MEISELTSSTGLPRSRIYEVLSSLASKGLLERRSSSSSNYRLLPPKQSIPRLMNSIRNEHQSHMASIEELGEFLHKQWKSEISDVSPGVEYISLEEVEPLFLDHLRRVKNRVWIAAADDQASINMRQSGRTLVSNKNEQVEVKYLISDGELASRIKAGFEMFGPFSKLKYQIKYNTELYTSFVILDHIIYIFFFGSAGKLEASALRTASSQLVKSFEWMFEKLWENAQTPGSVNNFSKKS